MKKSISLLIILAITSALKATNLAGVGFMTYSPSSFSRESDQENPHKVFAKLNIPVPILDGDDQQSNLYLLGGIYYNFLRQNPYIKDDYLTLGGLFTHKIAGKSYLNTLLAYNYYGEYNFTPLVHEGYIGIVPDVEIVPDFRFKYAVVRVRYMNNQFLMPSPSFQFQKIFNDNWSLKFSLLLDLKLSFYSPVIPTKLHVTYKKDKAHVLFGYDFDESIQDRIAQGEGAYLWMEGSRGAAFVQGDLNVFGKFWLGIKTGVALDMVSYYNDSGKRVKDSSLTENRFVPFFAQVNFSYDI